MAADERRMAAPAVGECQAFRDAWDALPAPLARALEDLECTSAGGLSKLTTDDEDDLAEVTRVLVGSSLHAQELVPAALALQALV